MASPDLSCEVLYQPGGTTDGAQFLDELNSATDPVEGAALARGIIDYCLERGAFVVATTHDPTLKLLPSVDSRIHTAAFSFDEEPKLGSESFWPCTE